MTAEIYPQPTNVSDIETEAAMRQYGIVEAPTSSYDFAASRYSNVADTIAQAKRQHIPDKSNPRSDRS